MFHRILLNNLSRSKPFLIVGAKGMGKTTLASEFANRFSNWIRLDLDTAGDRAIFQAGASSGETLKAISFLKGREIRGKGTLIVLDELWRCAEASRWLREHAYNKSVLPVDGPLVMATSSVMTAELEQLCNPSDSILQRHNLDPFSFEEFLMTMDDKASLEAFREVPVPYYAYDKLLNYFHQYALVGGLPEIVSEYAAKRHLLGLKHIYEKAGERFSKVIREATAGRKSGSLATEVLMNAYPFAATRVSYNHFGNLDKGSREIGQAFRILEQAFLLNMLLPVTSALMPALPDSTKFPRLQLVDTGLVTYFSGIQKPLYQSHDMNAIFEGQVARQVVGQEILATSRFVHSIGDAIAEQAFPHERKLNFWIRNKAQSTAEVDFVLAYDNLMIPVAVRSGEPGRLRSLHQFIDQAPHSFAVRLYAEKLAVQQTRTIRGKPFFLLNLPYFLAGKVREYLPGFIRLTEGR